MTIRALPDTLHIVSEYLHDVTSVTTYVSSRIYTTAPANPSFPAIILRRSGGIPAWFGDDRARIDVHCYGRTDEEARALAHDTFKALMEAPQNHDAGTLTDVKPASDLQELRDPTYRGTSAPSRYIFSIIATSHS